MNNIHSAVILVAGTGSRLRPLTDNVPKALVSLGEETILARMLRQLEACGIVHVVLATGFCEGALRAAIPPSRLSFDFCINPAYSTTQNAISLARCADAVAGESFVKLDGDLVLDQRILSRLIADPSPVSVGVDRTRILD
jgi:choline kinase